MGKYSKLGVHLKNSEKTILKLTFDEVGSILGFPLPKSARTYPAWWANNADSHTHTLDGWLAMGWKARVDLTNQIVVFTKKEKLAVIQQTEDYVPTEVSISAAEFEEKARIFMSKYYSGPLFAGKYPGVPKIFDMISAENKIVGDAKFYTMVRGKFLPPAKFATIAEHVWLLEKTEAKHRFLIFGNDKRVPEEWLKRYGALVDVLEFFFYDIGAGKIESLNGTKI
ncbi:MAG: hypothetical protein K8R11_02370 [Methanococcoides sp.]|nr:hypothetical protein [Methanococcoides sp.]